MADTDEPITFTVPATTANLGPGYGVLGLAVDLHLTVTLTPREDGELVVERHDAGRGGTLDVRHDPVLRGLRAGLDRIDGSAGSGWTVTVAGEVPRGCGLGTNSAAFAAGLGAAVRASAGTSDPSSLLGLLVELGGDPGHGAASLVGGLVAVAPLGSTEARPRFRVIPKALHDGWQLVFALPDRDMGTAETKRVLPAALPLQITPRTCGRVLGLVHALAFGDESLLGESLRDEVHVPYRRRLVPGMEEALAAGREAGAAGTTLSGHGPGLLAITLDADRTGAIGRAMVEAFGAAGVEARSLVLVPTQQGGLLRMGQ